MQFDYRFALTKNLHGMGLVGRVRARRQFVRARKRIGKILQCSPVILKL
jgi:hypothetical protein